MEILFPHKEELERRLKMCSEWFELVERLNEPINKQNNI